MTHKMTYNTLYYGDNLDIMRRYIPDDSIDLVYLDPPFNSKQNYNILFQEHNGTQSQSQIKAFGDMWHWDQGAALTYQQVVEAGGRLSEAIQSFRKLIGCNDMLAYLVMMAPRLAELRRVLKSTGSLYLHCDPTASHYLKLLLDAVFGLANFRNEIIWKRTSAHSDSGTCGNCHDTIFLYTKSNEFLWNKLHQNYDPAYIASHYRYSDESGRRFRTDNLTATGLSGGGYEYEWNGITKVWRLPKERMAELDKEGRIRYTAKGTAEYIRYLDEMPGVALQDVWHDISPINPQAKERLGYPTQKPEALLQRIIAAGSNEGDVVLDPFCGCGTTVSAAQKLNRNWIGIDITHIAITLIRHRLETTFGEEAEYQVIGEPASFADAETLAKNDPYQFQWWALGLVGARPVEQKKGADKGIDGRLYFHDEHDGAKTKQIILQVKAGSISPSQVRDLRGAMEREEAEIGVLLTLSEPSPAMRSEAASAGFYTSPWRKKPYPRLQVLTIAQLLSGKRIDFPPSRHTNVTFDKVKPRKSQR